MFNLSIEKSRNKAKSEIKLAIFQIDYLFNIFIPFLDSFEFKSKKALDLSYFKLMTTLISQGKYLIPEIKSFILQLSYTVNNYRLSTNKDLKRESYESKENLTNMDDKTVFSPKNLFKDKILALPPLFVKNNEGQIINIKTGKVIRDTFVVEVLKTNSLVCIYPTISDCASSCDISRTIIYDKLIRGKSVVEKGIINIRQIRVYDGQK